ncbi:hypothetical protein MC5_01915 [Rickettsia australis str. Cutlack]|uniref:Uncharacterized protein n=1 Tax=Rickettsia australis (strain Cutlack) TaxID=1105110 RepID=H8K9Q0_RICAC|nr:hypothetical protein MC5_01915 [Rickettsia australis str. Cutlack]
MSFQQKRESSVKLDKSSFKKYLRSRFYSNKAFKRLYSTIPAYVGRYYCVDTKTVIAGAKRRGNPEKD